MKTQGAKMKLPTDFGRAVQNSMRKLVPPVLTQQDLADRLNEFIEGTKYSQKQISSYITGTDIPLKFVEDCANLFNLSAHLKFAFLSLALSSSSQIVIGPEQKKKLPESIIKLIALTMTKNINFCTSNVVEGAAYDAFKNVKYPASDLETSSAYLNIIIRHIINIFYPQI